jgi:hypothetical protein
MNLWSDVEPVAYRHLARDVCRAKSPGTKGGRSSRPLLQGTATACASGPRWAGLSPRCRAFTPAEALDRPIRFMSSPSVSVLERRLWEAANPSRRSGAEYRGLGPRSAGPSALQEQHGHARAGAGLARRDHVREAVPAVVAVVVAPSGVMILGWSIEKVRCPSREHHLPSMTSAPNPNRTR